jgi:hypothetical protein
MLVEKRQSETLTPGEHEKLLQLTERFEALTRNAWKPLWH